jgi:hypothetical protein
VYRINVLILAQGYAECMQPVGLIIILQAVSVILAMRVILSEVVTSKRLFLPEQKL